MSDSNTQALLERIAEALDRLAPPPHAASSLDAADAFVWQAENRSLLPVQTVARVEIGLLRGVDRVRDILLDNTNRFAQGLPANNALLWGSRGMGKSSWLKLHMQRLIRREAMLRTGLHLLKFTVRI